MRRAMAMSERIAGGCLCGEIRFETPREPAFAEMGLASVNGLALDDRDHFQPAANHMPDSAPSWCRLADLPSM